MLYPQVKSLLRIKCFTRQLILTNAVYVCMCVRAHACTFLRIVWRKDWERSLEVRGQWYQLSCFLVFNEYFFKKQVTSLVDIVSCETTKEFYLVLSLAWRSQSPSPHCPPGIDSDTEVSSDVGTLIPCYIRCKVYGV